MGKKIYIDGNFLLKSGVFFGLDFWMYVDDKFKETADEIIDCSKDEIYEVTEDGGSMFNTYYVKGGITMYGENGSGIIFFKNEHDRTYTRYRDIQDKIIKLLEEAIIPEESKNYFYQQQYISLFANLEYFLYGTFMWETCQCYESYRKVLNSHLNFLEYKEAKAILRGEHCILQEKTFVEQIKYVIYHNAMQVGKLYKAAFNIDVDLNTLKNEIDIRNNIVHRAGYTKEGNPILIKRDDVMELKGKIDYLVDYITVKIKEFKAEYK